MPQQSTVCDGASVGSLEGDKAARGPRPLLIPHLAARAYPPAYIRWVEQLLDSQPIRQGTVVLPSYWPAIWNRWALRRARRVFAPEVVTLVNTDGFTCVRIGFEP